MPAGTGIKNILTSDTMTKSGKNDGFYFGKDSIFYKQETTRFLKAIGKQRKARQIGKWKPNCQPLRGERAMNRANIPS